MTRRSERATPRAMRQWMIGLAVIALLGFVSVADSPPSSLSPVLDAAYGSDSMQKLDVYPAAIASPAVIVVHGGGWTRGDKDLTEIRESSLRLQARGFAVFSMNYRLVDADNPGEPMQTDDVAAAVDWVIENGARYGADGTGIRLLGGSAGAQLVALAGQQINAARPGTIRGIIAMSGPMNFVRLVAENLLLTPQERDGKTIPLYLGCRLANCTAEEMQSVSPLYHIAPTTPPFLIVNSEDELVPADQAQEMHDALIAAGRSSTLRMLEGRDHGLSLFDAVETDIVTFLRD